MAASHGHTLVATPLPEVPADDFMNQTQWDVLFALLDGALPALATADAATDESEQVLLAQREFKSALELAASWQLDVRTPEALMAYLASRPSQSPDFRDDVVRTLAMSPQKDKLAKALGFMATRVGSLFMTGYWMPIYQQPAHVREAILKSWVNSSFPSMRALGKTMTTLAQKSNAVTTPYLQSLIGYPDVPKDWKAGLAYDYRFIQIPAGDEPHVITVDVVVVGSGCGGGVCAKNLAEAGHNVLVVDKGYYFPPTHLPMTQRAGLRYLFENGGAYMSEDGGGLSVTAGGAWGGGGTVNWSVSLKLQDYVRREWADKGLPMFTSTKFDEAVDSVREFMGVSADAVRHNHGNQVLLNGSQKLGWKAATAPQNTAGNEHYCGQCHLGCGSADKKGPAVSWLPAAAEAGAQFLEGFRTDKVLFDDDDETVAVGISGRWTSRGPQGEVHTPESTKTSREVVIKAKRVIVSAGSLQSPMLLMRSGLDNPNIGQNLHVHPCNFVAAAFKDDVRPWEGGIITSYCSEFENIDEEGHGVKLEPTCMVPYSSLALKPWRGGLESKMNVLKYRHENVYIALTRDRDAGRVFPDPTTGEPRIDYTTSDYDRAHTMEGVQALAKICYVMGASEILPYLPGIDPFVREPENEAGTADAGSSKDPEFTDPKFASWLEQLRAVGNKPPTSVFSSAHQMGTCRMSSTEEDGVVDDKGKVWGKSNLYVADASVFPSASGVNPMLTVMTISDWISRCVADDLASGNK
ncbi:hypothetical protein B0I35DRAFT_473849 [Stachybotrys elegans]|uniref:Long-chain-alcohol oxidase n=1 Tax=Stachybotrys elegans TaxID=80388 RepID=A0A8K0T4K2_9HYPO|nr:hypothetical protein B0I35DRAFT_473849 [Stachybotrys elegans]